jgi:hypothetical protein
MSNQIENNLTVNNDLIVGNNIISSGNITADTLICNNTATLSNLNVNKINNSITSANLNSLDTLVSISLQFNQLKQYVDQQIQTLFNNPDVNLNSIVEIANAIANDKNYATNISNSLADKLSISTNNQTVTANNLRFTNQIMSPDYLIQDVSNNITSTRTALINLQTVSSSNVSRIGTLETDNTSNKTRLNTLETDNSSNINRISTLESENTTNKSNINLKQNISDMVNYYTRSQSDSRFVLPSVTTEQTIPYLNTATLKSSTNESNSYIIHTDLALDNSYFNVMTFYAQTIVAGSKISIEILGGAPPFLQTNVNEPDKLIIDIVVLDNNPNVTTIPNVVSTHYFIGSNELNTDWCTDVLLIRNTEAGYTPNNFSWSLLLKLTIGTYAIFAKCSHGTTIKHNNINLGFASPTSGLTSTQWLRSVNSYAIRSPMSLYSSLNSTTITNSGALTTLSVSTSDYSRFMGGVYYPGMYSAILLDGVSSSDGFNKYNIMCSERKFGPSGNGNSDYLILMPNTGIILYDEVLYGGTGYVFRNTSTTTPQIYDFSSVQAYGNISNPLFLTTPRNINNSLNSCKLYRRQGLSWIEISYAGIS